MPASAAILWEWFSDRRRRRDVIRHLEAIPEEGQPGDPFRDLFRDTVGGESAWMAPYLQRLPRIADLQNMLQQADIGWRASTFLLLTVGAGTAFGLLGFLVTVNPLVGVATALLGSAAPYIYVQRKKNRRMRS